MLIKISYIQDKTKMESEKILLCVDAKDVKQLTYTVFNVRKLILTRNSHLFRDTVSSI